MKLSYQRKLLAEGNENYIRVIDIIIELFSTKSLQYSIDRKYSKKKNKNSYQNISTTDINRKDIKIIQL